MNYQLKMKEIVVKLDTTPINLLNSYYIENLLKEFNNLKKLGKYKYSHAYNTLDIIEQKWSNDDQSVSNMQNENKLIVKYMRNVISNTEDLDLKSAADKIKSIFDKAINEGMM
jgi:hypothetical protein